MTKLHSEELDTTEASFDATKQIEVREPRHKMFYRGLLMGLQAIGINKNQTEIALSPDHFDRLIELSEDYDTLYDICESSIRSESASTQRIADLEAALKPFADIVINEAARNAPRTTRLSPKMELKQFLTAHKAIYGVQ